MKLTVKQRRRGIALITAAFERDGAVLGDWMRDRVDAGLAELELLDPVPVSGEWVEAAYTAIVSEWTGRGWVITNTVGQVLRQVLSALPLPADPRVKELDSSWETAWEFLSAIGTAPASAGELTHEQIEEGLRIIGNQRERIAELEAENSRLRQSLVCERNRFLVEAGKRAQTKDEQAERIAELERQRNEAWKELVRLRGGHCKGCGAELFPEDAWMEDGCPCNTPKGVNDTDNVKVKGLSYNDVRVMTAETERDQARKRIAELEAENDRLQEKLLATTAREDNQRVANEKLEAENARLRKELNEDSSWKLVCRFLKAAGIEAASWSETTPEQIERAIESVGKMKAELAAEHLMVAGAQAERDRLRQDLAAAKKYRDGLCQCYECHGWFQVAALQPATAHPESPPVCERCLELEAAKETAEFKVAKDMREQRDEQANKYVEAMAEIEDAHAMFDALGIPEDTKLVERIRNQQAELAAERRNSASLDRDLVARTRELAAERAKQRPSLDKEAARVCIREYVEKHPWVVDGKNPHWQSSFLGDVVDHLCDQLSAPQQPDRLRKAIEGMEG